MSGSPASRLGTSRACSSPRIPCPNIDALFQDQAVELDRKQREAMLHKMQQLAYERTVYAPI